MKEKISKSEADELAFVKFQQDYLSRNSGIRPDEVSRSWSKSATGWRFDFTKTPAIPSDIDLNTICIDDERLGKVELLYSVIVSFFGETEVGAPIA